MTDLKSIIPQFIVLFFVFVPTYVQQNPAVVSERFSIAFTKTLNIGCTIRQRDVYYCCYIVT